MSSSHGKANVQAVRSIPASSRARSAPPSLAAFIRIVDASAKHRSRRTPCLPRSPSRHCRDRASGQRLPCSYRPQPPYPRAQARKELNRLVVSQDLVNKDEILAAATRRPPLAIRSQREAWQIVQLHHGYKTSLSSRYRSVEIPILPPATYRLGRGQKCHPIFR